MTRGAPKPVRWCESVSHAANENPLLQMNLRAEVFTTRKDLDPIAGQWNSVLRASKSSTIFLTWEWISAWLDAVRPDARVFVVIVRDRDARLIAIAPFYRTRLRLLGLVPYRCLRVIGDCDSGAEYPDVIIRSGFEHQAMSSVLGALLEHRDMWDCMWLPNVAGWTGALDRFERGCAGCELHLHERVRNFAAVNLPATHDAYLMLLSHKRRAYVRRETRRFMASSNVELIRCESRNDLPEMLEVLYDLHDRRWSASGQLGSFARQPRMRCFYGNFAQTALDNGWLRLYALKVDGAIRAVQYGYAYDGTFYALQEGYDPHQKNGIGNVLRNLVFRACIEEGLQEYDFLAGFTDHKRLWRAARRPGYDLFLGRRSLKNRLMFARPLWPTGRYIDESA